MSDVIEVSEEIAVLEKICEMKELVATRRESTRKNRLKMGISLATIEAQAFTSGMEHALKLLEEPCKQ
jgi:uroporphyrinogen-III synthase